VINVFLARKFSYRYWFHEILSLSFLKSVKVTL